MSGKTWQRNQHNKWDKKSQVEANELGVFLAKELNVKTEVNGRLFKSPEII